MKGYFAHLRRYSWVVLACSLVALGAGALVARTQPPTYQATSTLLVQAGAPGTTYPGGTAATFTAADNLNLATDYAAEIPTRVVMQYVIKSDPQLQKDQYTPDQLILDVLPSTAKTTPTITLLVTAAHPKNAVLLANDMALGFADYIRSLNQQSLDSLRTSLTDQIGLYRQQKASWEARIAALPNTTVPQYTVYTNELLDTTNILDSLQTRLQALPVTVRGYVSVVELAAPSDVTATSRGTILLAVFGGGGLLIGLLVMLLLIYLDGQLRSEREVREVLALAYLGGLAHSEDIGAAPTRPTGPVAQQLADISVNLRLTGVLPGRRQASQGATLLVTSPQAAEGKSSLAAGLAAMVARAGGTALVIDGNPAHPSTHLFLGRNAADIGLIGLLKGAGTPDDAVVRTSTQGIWFLPAGAPMEDPVLLIKQKMPAILEQLRSKVDLVIIDGPALLNSAASLLLASMADGVALVADARHEKLTNLERAKELLRSLARTPAGMVMNHLPRHEDDYYSIAYPKAAPPENARAIQTPVRGKRNGAKAPTSTAVKKVKVSP